jgi:hypothetical protein
MNAEIIYRLEQTFDPEIADYIAKLHQERRHAFLEQSRDPEVWRQIDALIDEARKSEGKKVAIVIEKVKRNPSGDLEITRQGQLRTRKPAKGTEGTEHRIIGSTTLPARSK